MVFVQCAEMCSAVPCSVLWCSMTACGVVVCTVCTVQSAMHAVCTAQYAQCRVHRHRVLGVECVLRRVQGAVQCVEYAVRLYKGCSVQCTGRTVCCVQNVRCAVCRVCRVHCVVSFSAPCCRLGLPCPNAKHLLCLCLPGKGMLFTSTLHIHPKGKCLIDTKKTAQMGGPQKENHLYKLFVWLKFNPPLEDICLGQNFCHHKARVQASALLLGSALPITWGANLYMGPTNHTQPTQANIGKLILGPQGVGGGGVWHEAMVFCNL